MTKAIEWTEQEQAELNAVAEENNKQDWYEGPNHGQAEEISGVIFMMMQQLSGDFYFPDVTIPALNRIMLKCAGYLHGDVGVDDLIDFMTEVLATPGAVKVE